MRMRFREVERNIENVEGNLATNANQQKGYLQIKPKTNITTEECIEYWNSVFKNADSVKKLADNVNNKGEK